MQKTVTMTPDQRKKLMDLTWTIASIANHTPLTGQFVRTEWQIERMLELSNELDKHLTTIKEGLVE